MLRECYNSSQSKCYDINRECEPVDCDTQPDHRLRLKSSDDCKARLAYRPVVQFGRRVSGYIHTHMMYMKDQLCSVIMQLKHAYARLGSFDEYGLQNLVSKTMKKRPFIAGFVNPDRYRMSSLTIMKLQQYNPRVLMILIYFFLDLLISKENYTQRCQRS